MLQEPEKPLLNADCTSQLRAFQGFDPDGGIFGDINFTISSDNGDDQYFTILKENRSKSHLRLKTPISGGTYKLNVAAVDGDGKISKQGLKNIRVVFIDVHGSPSFAISKFKTNFTENEEGLIETRYIPEGEDPKNEGIEIGDEIYKMYYFIDETFRTQDAKLFLLNKYTRELKLSTTLDREKCDKHVIRIRVANDINRRITNPTIENYLTVEITVNDVNDNIPSFNDTSYAAGITVKDLRGKQILTYFAYDPDLNDATSYAIINDSFCPQGENIKLYTYNIFELDKDTGVLRLSTPVSSTAKGYFMFDVMAYDTAQPSHIEIVSTKIYIIAESNRVKFVFLSGIEDINKHEKFIRKQFEEMYGYETCNIDNIEGIGNQNVRHTDNLFAPITEVVAHFIHNNEAVDATEIEKRSDDLRFISKLQNSFQKRNLILNDVPHSKPQNVEQHLESLLTVTLIVVSVLLAIVCLMLITAFVMKTSALNRRLKAFEAPEFGSTPSNLNRTGVPTTNIFSIEGSNPVINKKQFDAEYKHNSNKWSFDDPRSDSEDESDFIGISNDPTFVIKENN